MSVTGLRGGTMPSLDEMPVPGRGQAPLRALTLNHSEASLPAGLDSVNHSEVSLLDEMPVPGPGQAPLRALAPNHSEAWLAEGFIIVNHSELVPRSDR